MEPQTSIHQFSTVSVFCSTLQLEIILDVFLHLQLQTVVNHRLNLTIHAFGNTQDTLNCGRMLKKNKQIKKQQNRPDNPTHPDQFVLQNSVNSNYKGTFCQCWLHGRWVMGKINHVTDGQFYYATHFTNLCSLTEGCLRRNLTCWEQLIEYLTDNPFGTLEVGIFHLWPGW